MEAPFDETVQRKTLKDEIFDVLNKRIIAGKHAPGEWLRQEEIASQLGVSQTPVREALDLLVSAGLAERVPYTGVRVAKLSTDDIVDSYGMRLLLEPAATRWAADLIQKDQVDGLYRILDEMKSHETLNDMSTQRQLSREFHQSIVNASRNALMVRVYQVVANAFPDWMMYEVMYRRPELLEESLAQEYAEHRAVVDALAAGKPELAAQKAMEHVLHLGRDLESLLQIPGELIKEKERQTLAIIKPS
jgi:DNA-binding GntR family transcriptional regulator